MSLNRIWFNKDAVKKRGFGTASIVLTGVLKIRRKGDQR
jgi:hypothetical protein